MNQNTVINIDEDNDDEDLMVNLTKDRRSGHDRRFEVVEPNSAREFRREVEREYRAEIRQLREEETRKDLEIAELKAEISTIREWQNSKEKVLLAAEQIVSAGTVFKWIIGSIIGTTMLIGGVSASIEIIRAWTR